MDFALSEEYTLSEPKQLISVTQKTSPNGISKPASSGELSV